MKIVYISKDMSWCFNEYIRSKKCGIFRQFFKRDDSKATSGSHYIGMGRHNKYCRYALVMNDNHGSLNQIRST